MLSFSVSLSNSKNAKVDLVLEDDLFSFVMASATLPYFLFTELVCLSKELSACNNGHYYVFPAWWNRDSAACILGDVWTRFCTCWWSFFPSLVALEFWISMWRFGLQFTHDLAIDVSLAWTRIEDLRLSRIATNRTLNLSLCVSLCL